MINGWKDEEAFAHLEGAYKFWAGGIHKICAYVNACKRDYSDIEALGFPRTVDVAMRLLNAAASGLRNQAALPPMYVSISVVDPLADDEMDVEPSSTAAASGAPSCRSL